MFGWFKFFRRRTPQELDNNVGAIWRYSKASDVTCDALIASLAEMVECYGSDDGGGPIPIIERAKAAIAAAMGHE